ncbi:Gfo/Idh/MocA family oxidoreductase [bacterium]|nr:Gfo/Idh/MocA family oxidoreductase [bacterium]
MSDVRWGILGAGSVARRRVLPAIQSLEGHEIAALMVRNKSRAEDLAADFGAERAHTSAEDLIADAGVNAVYVSSPVNLHLAHTLASARAGKQVLCEKPMAMSAEECAQMIRVCEEAGGVLGVCFVLRGWEIYQRIREHIRDGRFGTIVEIRAHLAKWTPRDASEWRLDPAQSGGGTLVDVATHYLDLFRYLLGDITKVAYMGSHRVFSWPVEETAHTLVEFESGVHGTLTATCTVPSGGNVLEVYGSEGSLFLGNKLRIVTGDAMTEEDVVFPDYYSGLLSDFGRCVGSGDVPIASGLDGLRCLQVTDAAYRSDTEQRIATVADE